MSAVVAPGASATATGGPAVVVGAGIAGLAAARALAQAGLAVTVVDPAPPGGKLRTSPFAGRLVDEGADAFLLRVPWAIDLCRDLGLEGELIHPAARNAYIWSRGALRPLPPQLMGVPVDLVAVEASGLLSDEGLQALRDDLTAPWEASRLPATDVTIADALGPRIGTEAVERIVDPLVGGINAGDTRRLSLAAVVPQLDAAARDLDHDSLIEACRAQQARAREGGTDPADPIFAAPAAGMARLVEALVADLQGRGVVVVADRAAAVEPGRVVLHGGGDLPADLVVLAVPAHAAPGLLADASPLAAEVLGGIDHASVAMVTVSVDPADLGHPLDASGYLVPRVEPTRALTACSWSSAKWANLGAEHGDGTVVLRASAGRAGDEGALDLDDDDLVAAIADDLARTMDLRGAPRAARVTRWVDGLPQYEPGHLGRIVAAEADVAERAPWLALAGAALRGVGIPACIRSGQDAAARLLATRGAAP